MCITFLYINPKPTPNSYKVILVSNRDEYFHRPTEPASIWDTDPKIIAGKDVMAGREGGTWLGLSEKGKIGSLLNIFQSKDDYYKMQEANSRGFLVVDYLLGKKSFVDYTNSLIDSQIVYNQFNLLMIEKIHEKFSALYYNNFDFVPEHLSCGFHGFGNSLYKEPFQKVLKGKEKMREIVSKFDTKEAETELVNSLCEMMKDSTQYLPDDQIYSKGKGYPEFYLNGLSRICVRIPEVQYGTRTTSVILIDGKDVAHFEERTMTSPSPDCKEWTTNAFDMPVVS